LLGDGVDRNPRPTVMTTTPQHDPRNYILLRLGLFAPQKKAIRPLSGCQTFLECSIGLILSSKRVGNLIKKTVMFESSLRDSNTLPGKFGHQNEMRQRANSAIRLYSCTPLVQPRTLAQTFNRHLGTNGLLGHRKRGNRFSERDRRNRGLCARSSSKCAYH
jgi:hypothetical protein